MAVFLTRFVYRQFRSFSSSAACANGFQFIKVSDEGNVRRIRLDSPKTRHALKNNKRQDVVFNFTSIDRNAMSLELMNELSTAFLGTIGNDELHCVVLSAEGPVFSAGHNLKELVNLNFGTCLEFFKQPHLNFL